MKFESSEADIERRRIMFGVDLTKPRVSAVRKAELLALAARRDALRKIDKQSITSRSNTPTHKSLTPNRGLEPNDSRAVDRLQRKHDEYWSRKK